MYVLPFAAHLVINCILLDTSLFGTRLQVIKFLFIKDILSILSESGIPKEAEDYALNNGLHIYGCAG